MQIYIFRGNACNGYDLKSVLSLREQQTYHIHCLFYNTLNIKLYTVYTIHCILYSV